MYDVEKAERNKEEGIPEVLDLIKESDSVLVVALRKGTRDIMSMRLQGSASVAEYIGMLECAKDSFIQEMRK